MTCAYSLLSLGLDGICKQRTFRALTSPNWLQMFHHVHRKHPGEAGETHLARRLPFLGQRSAQCLGRG